MSVSITRIVKFIRKGEKGDKGNAGENGITISLLPAALTPKVGVSSTLRVQVALYDGGRLIGYNDETDGNMLCSILPTSSAYKWTFRVESGKFYFFIMLTPTDTTAISLPFTITYKGAKYDSVITIQPVADGQGGARGDRGPALRGPQAWSDCAVGYVFQSGASGEDYKDVVLYGNNYYSCIKSHTKTASNNPGSATDTNSGLWKLADKLEMVATKILLAQYALVKNLGVEAIDMKDADGNIIFQAKDGNVTCNSGTFKNITVKGNSSFEGSVKANMFYGTVKKVTPGSTYTIDPVNEPYNFYYVENPTKRTFIVLPKAANYEGLEINIFTKSLPSTSLSYRTIVTPQTNDDFYVKQNVDIVSGDTAVEKINVNYTNFKNDSITTALDSYIRFKCIGGAWYAISGQFTGE